MNLAQLLTRTALVYPENPAVFLGSRQLLTYSELAARASSVAGYLRNCAGLEPGARVVIFMSNCPEYLELLYGIWWAGLVAVPVNYKLHPKEAQYILEDSQAAAAFVSAEFSEDILLAGLPVSHVLVPDTPEYFTMLASRPTPVEARTAGDLAWLFYTSGTTGKPKGVMLSNHNLLAMTSAYFINVDDVSPLDAAVYAAPFSHGAGLYHFPNTIKGGRHVIPVSGGFEPAELVELSKSIGRLSMFAAPTMVKRLTEHIAEAGVDPSGFKTIVYGGGPMYAEDIKQALSLMGPRFVQIYGQGETPMTITVLPRDILANASHPQWEQRIASVGIAQSFVEVRVVDAAGQTLPAGEIGEVLVRGDTVMSGYWNNPEATASTLRDGWLWTGDTGCFDESGFLTLKDRSKDVIISGGSNIYPREVEEILLMHPAVKEVSVVGKNDPEWGEIVVAFVVSGGVTTTELDALCLQHIARFKRPKEYHFVSSLPKNNYGKVLKTDLRKLLQIVNDTETQQ
jgi:long-chain acyl-CoA synthetase